jgi:hypothetical protein
VYLQGTDHISDHVVLDCSPVSGHPPLSGQGLGSPATSGQVIPGLTILTTRPRLTVGRITPNLIPLVTRWMIPKHPGTV